MKFINKGLTIKKLENNKFFKKYIPKFFLLNKIDYYKKKNNFLKLIDRSFDNQIIIRSSSNIEDQNNSSMAGKFDSYLNINSYDKNQIDDCIEKIFKSYSNYKTNGSIIIQEMINNSKISGVLTTAVISNMNPNYFEINYSTGVKTDIVTSGKKGIKNLIFYKDYYLPKKYTIFRELINVSKKLSNSFNNNYLDIEFLIDKKSNLKILQVRPLSSQNKNVMRNNIDENLYSLKKKIIKLKKANNYLFGKTTYFGLMADWNPAEIIGIKPKMLSYSVYKELITNNIWSIQRYNYGYNLVKETPLMLNFFGTPYIDIRADFNSWLPNDLSNNLKEKLTNFYLKKLLKNTNHHDKIEFEIIFSCNVFNTKEKLKELSLNSFNKIEINQIHRALINITKISVNNLKIDKKKIEILDSKQNKIVSSNIDILQKIFFLNQNCKYYGTLPFAGIARNGFIAIELLNSLVEMNLITENDKNAFLNSISNVASNLRKDFINLSKSKFLKKYGHLRPNTYDIETKNYKEGYDEYFNNKNIDVIYNSNSTKFYLDNSKKNKINKYLKKSELPFLNHSQLFSYFRLAIEYREKSKFIFSKSISLIFDHIILLGERLKISRYNLSHIDYSLILSKYSELNLANLDVILKKNINNNKKEYINNSNIPLPELLINDKDIYCFKNFTFSGNYFGKNTVEGEIINIEKLSKIQNLNGKIILIRNADPGFDFIFNYKIKALITCYGGANSHMAIRCSELNITGVIGVGEIRYNKIKSSKRIMINPIIKKYNIS